MRFERSTTELHRNRTSACVRGTASYLSGNRNLRPFTATDHFAASPSDNRWRGITLTGKAGPAKGD